MTRSPASGVKEKPMKRLALLAVTWVCFTTLAWAEQHYSVKGLVLEVDKSHHTLVVSCQRIPGYMEAMAMPFPVRDPKDLDRLAPGMLVEFTLIVNQDSSYAENICVHGFESVELDPLAARRLKIIDGILDSSSAKVLEIGQRVPDFELTDQNRQLVTLSQFANKVVGITFIYTRCPLPNYCFRLSNNFGILQKRFTEQMGRDLVLLSITFDPANDRPEVLNKYAAVWKADPKGWHLLTGPPPDIQKVCRVFGISPWRDEGLLIHSLRTVVINRQGKLAASLEGNDYTAAQLGDLVQTIMSR